MDDYNISAISEAKNEYSARLVNIITPLVIEGIKSIFKEALELCIVNEEREKYLMTFQNFLTRVPKWNQNIIDSETKRIIDKSKCTYLEDLIACVHISQLKILTSIRVSNKQKKVEIDIPKINDFIHNTYIIFARKLYSNIYLFETTIPALQIQKNNRECELICKECILNVIRENIPVDKILRAYIDETEEEEVINETTLEEKPIEKPEEIPIIMEEPKIVKEDLTIPIVPSNNVTDIVKVESTNIKKIMPPLMPTKNVVPPPLPSIVTSASPKKHRLMFSDNDQIKEYNTSSSPRTTSSSPITTIIAPKTIKRLEEISTERNIQRKIEEQEDEDDDEDKITIFGNTQPLKLDVLEIQSLPSLPSKPLTPKIKLNTNPLKIETLI
jgi:hypothetical protein|tara:strand:- start:1282 stop:2436 length:1155 start_codon:yes stop_codon:yes gene_type:complete